MITHPIIFVAATALALIGPIAGAQTLNDRVRIEVRVLTDQERKEIKGSRADSVTQKKTLQIAVAGKPKSPETRTGKWTVYGRDVKSKSIAVIESGEFKLELPVAGQQKVDSKAASMTYTPEHAAGSGKGSKKVEAEGIKYIGYGVVVKDGETVVSESYDPPGLKQEVAK